MPFFKNLLVAAPLLAIATAGASLNARPAWAETLQIGIGTQNTTTNTVTGGVVLRQLGLFEKNLPHDGKYKDFTYQLNWQNFTSGPPVTNGMMADEIQIGMMGDYPLLVNGATGQATGNETQLVAILAYNAVGSGNGIVVNAASNYFDLSDLKGKTVSVPFGSAAHGMLLAALQERHLPTDYWPIVAQSPEIGTTNLKEQRIDAHADFVPFAELLPFRGFARKIFDGAETKTPTFHGVVVRKDFAQKYPEIVVAYLKSVIEANAWYRKDPKAASEKVDEWTKINKEVAYIFLGPDGIMTLDPTIKPRWVEAMKGDYAVLDKLKMIKPLNVDAWVNDTYIREAFKQDKLDYDAQLADLGNYHVAGDDPICHTKVGDPKLAGQIWIEGGDIVSTSTPSCTLQGVKKYLADGKKIDAVYLVDHELGVKVFADKAFYAVEPAAGGKQPEIVPFLLKPNAEAFAAKQGWKTASYDQVIDSFK